MASVQVEIKQKKKRYRQDADSVRKTRNLKSENKPSSPEAILKNYFPFFENSNNIIAKAKQGLEISAVSDFAIVSGKSQKKIAELIHSTAKTLQNYRSVSKKLSTLQTEFLLKLFALYDKGLGIFDGVENFNGWLQSPAFGLYNAVPETLLPTSTGIHLVMDQLIRIEYGDFS